MNTSDPSEAQSVPEDQWWVAKSGKHHGPYSVTKINAEIRDGNIKRETLICVVGGDAWIAAAEADQFRVSFDMPAPQRAASPSEESKSPPPGIVINFKLPTPHSPSKDSLKAVFRYLLVGEICFYFIAIVFAMIGLEMTAGYPEIETSEFEEISNMVLGAIGIAFVFPATMLAWFALFSLRNWARWLYLGLFVLIRIIDVPTSAVSYSITWELSASLFELASVCTGAILALAFLSPLSDCFRGKGEVVVAEAVEVEP